MPSHRELITAARARVDRRDELAYQIKLAVERDPDTIRYDEDDWTRMADALMSMIDTAQQQALTEAADYIERHVSQVGPASQALAPGQAFAVAVLRDRVRHLPAASGGSGEHHD